MSEFIIDAPGELIDYFHLVAEEIVNTYHVSRAEAIARINCHWRGRAFQSQDDLVLHGMPDYWAERIYLEDYIDEEGRFGRRARRPPSLDSECWTAK